MNKRFISLCMAAVILLSMLPYIALPASAETIASGTSKEGFRWTLDHEGTLTITGKGAMKDYTPAGGGYMSWIDASLGSDYINQIKRIILSDGITNIGNAAFDYCKNLVSVEIPDTVTTIGDFAFLCCFKLESVVIPNSVTTIGRIAFRGCEKLPQITIPKSVTTIRDGAFSICDALSSIRFEGDAPEFANNEYEPVFEDVTATVYYPHNNKTWTASVRQNYGGKLTWVPYNPNNPFTDVPAGAWYENSVLWALENGITTGATADTFNPNGQCLRAHVVTFLHRAAENPEPGSSSNPFTDVKSTDFFYKPVLWAVEKGITNGISASKFGSYDVCNRAAVVTFLWRAAGSPEPESTDNPFKDVKASDFFYKPVLWAVENGITNGLTATEFGPNTACNRAQVVTFLSRAYND